MQKAQSQILERFWIAWNMVSEHRRIDFEMKYLTKLVQDYGISSDWLLTGSGPMLKDEFDFYYHCRN